MNGILIIKKEKEYTSHDVVAIVKKLLKEKVGHTGTLDPLAQGVLPLLIGKGTLVSKYLINHDKIYEVELKLGQRTETLDAEGEVIEEQDVSQDILEKDKIEEVLKTFLGKQEQTPPIYSAIKVKGKKLYEYARQGKEVEIPKRNIEIYNIELINIDKCFKTISFRVECSKGTYIRSLCDDIAKKLGTIGFMKELNRTKVGQFDIKQAITIEELKSQIDNIQEKIISIEKLFENTPEIILNDRKKELMLNGVKITVELDEGIYKLYDSNKIFIGIGTVKNNSLKRDIIL